MTEEATHSSLAPKSPHVRIRDPVSPRNIGHQRIPPRRTSFSNFTRLKTPPRGTDTCRLLIHKSARKLRKAAKLLDEAYSSDDEELIDGAELWLASDSGIRWFNHDWKYWDQDQDEGALESLGWERVIVESAACYRVTLRVARKA